MVETIAMQACAAGRRKSHSQHKCGFGMAYTIDSLSCAGVYLKYVC